MHKRKIHDSPTTHFASLYIIRYNFIACNLRLENLQYRAKKGYFYNNNILSCHNKKRSIDKTGFGKPKGYEEKEGKKFSKFTDE